MLSVGGKSVWFRVRKYAKRLLIILVSGLGFSLMQAWGSVILVDFGEHQWMDTSFHEWLDTNAYTRRIDGDLKRSKEWKNGKGPADADGYAWWYHQNTYPWGVLTVSLGELPVPDAERLWPTAWEDPSVVGLPPRWSRSRNKPSVADWINPDKVFRTYELAAGWPMTSFYGTVEQRWSANDGPKFLWSLPYTRLKNETPAFLPYRPFFPGVLVNALFYGSLAYLFWIAIIQRVGRTRNKSRSKRGCCESCGYDITGLSICPECGQSVVGCAQADR